MTILVVELSVTDSVGAESVIDSVLESVVKDSVADTNGIGSVVVVTVVDSVKELSPVTVVDGASDFGLVEGTYETVSEAGIDVTDSVVFTDVETVVSGKSDVLDICGSVDGRVVVDSIDSVEEDKVESFVDVA